MTATKSLAHTVIVPALDIDALLFADRPMSPRCRLERRIVAALIAHMSERGWVVDCVNDTEEITPVTDAKSAMELIFNLDDSYLYFRKADNTRERSSSGVTPGARWVRLIGGNGIDILSDYAVSERDGFGAAVDAFDAEVYA